MQKTKLKTCPFCGCEAKIAPFLGRWCVVCTVCPGVVISLYADGKEDMIRLWNMRDSSEYMKHYRRGRKDAEAIAKGELMQAFSPD